MSPQLSVVVPIYNTGSYLRKCLRSLTCQTLADIEIILIDDGSSDDSGKICDEYASKDSRIHVVHKKNEGVSIARNVGIEMSKGEYIGFMDSDDWAEHEMFKEMMDAAVETHVDIVICDMLNIYEDGRKKLDTISLLTGDCLIMKSNISPHLLIELTEGAWRCIYRKELLNFYDIKFPSGLKLSEDRIFNIYAFGYCDTIFYKKRAYYNHFFRVGSASNRNYDDMLRIVLDARKSTMESIDIAWDQKKEIKDVYEQQVVELALRAIYNEFHKKSNNNLRTKYKNIKEICKNTVVKNSIKNTGSYNIRVRLLYGERVFVLCLVAILFRIKNRKFR